MCVWVGLGHREQAGVQVVYEGQGFVALHVGKSLTVE